MIAVSAATHARGRISLHCLLHSGDSGCYLLLESLAMLAAAVLACRLVCSACQALDPLVLHALPFNLHEAKIAC